MLSPSQVGPCTRGPPKEYVLLHQSSRKRNVNEEKGSIGRHVADWYVVVYRVFNGRLKPISQAQVSSEHSRDDVALPRQVIQRVRGFVGRHDQNGEVVQLLDAMFKITLLLAGCNYHYRCMS